MNKMYKDLLLEKYNLERIEEDGLDYLITIRLKEASDITTFFETYVKGLNQKGVSAIQCPAGCGAIPLSVEQREFTLEGKKVMSPCFGYKCEKCGEEFTTTESDTFSLVLIKAAAASPQLKWVKASEDMPPECTAVFGYCKKWIDEDYNPEGVRECIMWDDGEWSSAHWDNEQDCWDTDENTKPTHWMRLPEPPSGAAKEEASAPQATSETNDKDLIAIASNLSMHTIRQVIETEEARTFLENEVKSYAPFTQWGLNELPCVLYDAVAKCMVNYAAQKLAALQQWEHTSLLQLEVKGLAIPEQWVHRFNSEADFLAFLKWRREASDQNTNQ